MNFKTYTLRLLKKNLNMCERIKPEMLHIGQTYQIMDNQRFVVNGIFEGDHFTNVATKEIIKNPSRAWY